VAESFAELGYRRATTAELARRCRVRENILYRLWKDKRDMFLASLDSLFERRRNEMEEAVRRSKPGGSRARKMLAHAAQHFGDDSLARVIFSGLAETGDPEIREALARMYGSYRSFLEKEIRAHRKRRAEPDVEASALALIGLGTILSVLDEVGAVRGEDRKAFFAKAFQGVGRVLLEGVPR
jgi:AcrR family transcriptional regulator